MILVVVVMNVAMMIVLQPNSLVQYSGDGCTRILLFRQC